MALEHPVEATRRSTKRDPAGRMAQAGGRWEEWAPGSVTLTGAWSADAQRMREARTMA
jgi:hypothetical protein